MMLKQVVLAHFEPVGTGFGSWKIPKCLENGPFWDQKWFKNGSKTRFFKSDPGPFGMLKQVFLARFEPVELGEGCRLEDIYIYIYICIYIYIYIYTYIYIYIWVLDRGGGGSIR